MHDGEAHIVKLGGSLLDLSDVFDRLAAFRRDRLGPRGMLVVGGGEAADLVRRFDALHALGEHDGHWLAVRAMQLNAHLVARVLPNAQLVSDVEECESAWRAGELAIMEPIDWLEREHAAGITIPHRWQFTSDSIAAHVCGRLGGGRLTLLKSTLPNGDGLTLADAARHGVVDAELPRAAAGLREVALVNLRAAGQPACVWAGE